MNDTDEAQSGTGAPATVATTAPAPAAAQVPPAAAVPAPTAVGPPVAAPQQRQPGSQQPQAQRAAVPGSLAPEIVHTAPKTITELMLWTFASMMHTFVGCLGLIFLLHAGQAGLLLRSGGMFQELGGAWDALVLLLGNFALPFSETAAMAATSVSQESVGFEVFSFWLPGMLGALLLLTGAFAHLALRFRRLAFILPYSFLAVVFLVWQVELGKMLHKVAHEEEIELTDDQTRLHRDQAMQYFMFNMTYEGFVAVYEEQQCVTTLPSVNSGAYVVNVDCHTDTLEANLLKVATMQLCRAVPPVEAAVEDYDRRVNSCLTQGRRLQILPQPLQPRDTVFCRCRSAMYDWLRIMSRWISVVWFAELAAACTVLYFGVEANLARMDATARREILGFAAVGVIGLAIRVSVFADKLPDEGAAEL